MTNNTPSSFAGISLEKPIIMGILNRTPDSFSDGGDFMDTNAAIDHAHRMIEDGASIIDIGGESTRPNADDVSIDNELQRVLPIIQALKGKIPISIDTRKSIVMVEALKNGASIVNDVSALTDDAESLSAIRPYMPHIILMHKRGQPKTMMQNTTYDHVVHDSHAYLSDRINACAQAGIPKTHLAIDPGIGFGKTRDQDLLIHKMIHLYLSLGCPLVLGSSRKKFLTPPTVPPKERDGASIASVLWGIHNGVSVVRVHNVAQVQQAITLWHDIQTIKETKHG